MSDLTGKVLGDYRLERLIGTGAFGQVYRASQVLSGGAVALKVIDERLTSDPDFKLRFVDYAQLLAGLSHPHVIKVHHLGEQEGYAFVVMELLAGPSFESLRSVPLVKDWDPALWSMVSLVREAAEGVAAVHARGVVHGDIKRSNLVLTTTDRATAHVKVTDVGVRRLVPSATGAEDDDHDKGIRRDLRALGYILYEATTGRLLTSTDGAAPTNVTPPGQLVAGYPAALELVLSRCIDAASPNKFATAGELRDALMILCDAETGRLRPASADLAVVAPAPALTIPPRRELQIARSTRPPRPPQPSARATGVPALHVLDGAGAPIEVQHLRGAGLTIGTSPDSDIMVESPDVSATHARIDWDGQRVMVTDLGSATNSKLDGHLLLPQVAQEWGREQWLQIGPYWLWLEQPVLEIKQLGIEVLLDQSARVMELTPGKPTVCRLNLINHMVRVDRVTLDVHGVPAEWVEGADRETRLQPNERKEVTLAVHVPRTPAGKAGKYSVTIAVNSAATPDGDHGTVEAHWTVLEFWAADVSISPTKTSGFTHATYSVTLHNEGNGKPAYTLVGHDENKYLTCGFTGDWYSDRERPQLELEPGETKTIKVLVSAPRLWFGSSASHGFTIEGTPAGRPERMKVEGQFTQRPVFPMWMIAALPILLIAFIYIGMQYGKPEVRTVYIEPLIPNAGQAVSIHWDAPRATRIRLSVNDSFVLPDPDPKQAKYIFADGFTQSTRIKVLGSNWFGDAAQEVTVAPKPPPPAPPAALPVIDLFVVRPLTVAPNQEVTIQWHTINATRVELDPIGTVELQGMTTASPAASQSYTLTAYNKDNQTAKKTLQVQVKEGTPPNPILTFSGSSPDAKPNSQGAIALSVGETVIFQWSARNAQSVRIDAVNPVMLQGASGQKVATIAGEGHYTFALVATNAKGEEFRSNEVEVTATCSKSRFFVLKFPCGKSPQVKW